MNAAPSLELMSFNSPTQEYCLADLSQYEQKRLALRWRTEDEVISGKGVLGVIPSVCLVSALR